MNLLTTSNPKILKSLAVGYLTAILHLSPYKKSGVNFCPKATQGCINACLDESGMGVFEPVQYARLKRSRLYIENPIEFMKRLYADIHSLERKALRIGTKLAIRLNGTSDIPKLALQVAKDFPHIQFYDYTKILATLKRKDLPSNYHLTFSKSESNADECIEALRLGFNVAMVFDEVPQQYLGYKVIDGDEHDLRFLDEKGTIVGLKAKGKAKKDESGFVIQM